MTSKKAIVLRVFIGTAYTKGKMTSLLPMANTWEDNRQGQKCAVEKIDYNQVHDLINGLIQHQPKKSDEV